MRTALVAARRTEVHQGCLRGVRAESFVGPRPRAPVSVPVPVAVPEGNNAVLIKAMAMVPPTLAVDVVWTQPRGSSERGALHVGDGLLIRMSSPRRAGPEGAQSTRQGRPAEDRGQGPGLTCPRARASQTLL